MMTVFRWAGQVIPDVHVWAQGRGEEMVTYRAARQVPNAATGHMDTETYDDVMPASFFDNLQMSNGWRYTELSRRPA